MVHHHLAGGSVFLFVCAHETLGDSSCLTRAGVEATETMVDDALPILRTGVVRGERLLECDFPAQPEDRQVHVWPVSLDPVDAAQPALEAILSDQERERAGRYVFERDRRRFIAGRATLRIVLAEYLGVSAEAIGFREGPNGKPYLSSRLHRGLEFNMSRSHGLGLIAICVGEEVGVDVELVRDVEDAANIVQRFFCPEEIAQWMALDQARRTHAFFDCWTRKEAYVKAVGAGLQIPLNSFAVSFRPGETPTVRLHGDRACWSVFDVGPSAAYAAALAVRGSGWRCVSTPWRPREVATQSPGRSDQPG